jgi:hypothetical protein
MLKRSYRLAIRLAPEEKKVLDILSDTFTNGDQAQVVREMLQEVGASYGILAPGDLTELQKPGRMSKSAYV